MNRTYLVYIVVIVTVATYVQGGAKKESASVDSQSSAPQRALLDRYCVTCHNQKLKTAGLMLDRADLQNPSVDAEIWEKVVRKLRTAAMPPTGMPRPEKAAADALASYLETALDHAAIAKPNPGRPAVHRLNRAEYTNAVRDLLGIDMDGPALLPPDDSGYGFDNNADVLTVSPVLLDRYMSSARQISRLAVGDPAMHSVEITYSIPRYLTQEDRMGEDLPFGSRGGIAVRHWFPLDGEYVIKIRLKRNYSGDTIVGNLAKPHHLDIRFDGTRLKLITVGPIDQKTGGATKVPADEALELRIAAKAGTHLLGVAFINEYLSKAETVFRPRVADQDDDVALGSVTINGPHNVQGPGETPSRRRIFLCRPAGDHNSEEQSCATKIISNLARRAYRRPVTRDDIQALQKPYHAARKNGTFETAVEAALRAILISPDFLFRIEQDPANAVTGAAYRISDVELASRLSFFLWSSMPDDELMDLAERGKLRQPEVLQRQVRRMLTDSRSNALIGNFAGQWLYLRNIDKVLPDPKEFPEFDENLRQAFQQETALFFESMLRDDRSIVDLLDANYTFVNERLARHYGLRNIYGSQFRRITVADENRRGLLGQGSILTVTSYANRTSPTLRGKWLLENILGAPPPPPPANVPSLKDRGEDGKILSVRQQMEQHRKNPACAVCHARMDPLGFALDNFDAVGKWRTASGADNTSIDSSGVLPDGTKFNGPAELRQILFQRREQFVTVVAEKLLTYALGRGVEYYDQPAVRKIMHQAAPAYRWSSVILGIVKSTPFQMRRSKSS